MTHSGKMRAVIKPERSPGLEMALVDIPRIGSHDALIQVKATSICGTDLHIFKWDPWARAHINPPIVVGHEFCGEVVEVGSEVTQVKVGDFVSAESHITCQTCAQCRTGNGHICKNTRIIGVGRDGCWAEYIAMPEFNLWLNPPDMPVEIASLQENFGNAVHTAFATDVTARKVLVSGCGPVGLMTIAVCKAAGARQIFATDISPYRLRLARQMGATHALNVAEVDVVETIRHDTDGEGVDASQRHHVVDRFPPLFRRAEAGLSVHLHPDDALARVGKLPGDLRHPIRRAIGVHREGVDADHVDVEVRAGGRRRRRRNRWQTPAWERAWHRRPASEPGRLTGTRDPGRASHRHGGAKLRTSDRTAPHHRPGC